MDYNKYSKDVHTIIDNLSKEESNHIGNGYWVDSNHIIYRKVEYVGNKPVGFIDVYSLPKFKRYGLIIIAVSKEARGKGIGKKLVNSAIQNCKNNKDIDKLRWLADSDNIVSINMAKSLGFKLNDDEDKKEFIYDLRGECITESCKDVETARKFLQEVDDLSKKYDANFFIVTDGASMTRNGRGKSEPAVKNARDSQIEWEKKNGGDPDEDWLKHTNESNNYIAESPDKSSLSKEFTNKKIEPVFDKILKLNDRLNDYEYIIPNNGNPITHIKNDDFIKYYVLLSPNEFEKYKGGVCWDYVAYEAMYFRAKYPNIKFETYYQVIDNRNDNPTHTFLIFEFNKKWYWFESSWKINCGIYGFDNKSDCIEYIMQKLKLPGKNYGTYICKFDATDATMYGMNCVGYMNYMSFMIKPYKFTNKKIEPIFIYKGHCPTDSSHNKYYRVLYGGIGIYEAFKRIVPINVWLEFKKSTACRWLPLPPKYENNYYSYFTYEGYKKFMDLTYPKMLKYLNKDKIETSIVELDENSIVYSDKYQIVATNNNYMIESEDNCPDDNEDYTMESVIFNSKDIYYNKDKFDSGEINLCFITGFSGSGKSTMADEMEKSGIEKYELDDIVFQFNFSDENLKEYGGMISSFFNGPGKKYRAVKSIDDLKTDKEADDYQADICIDFIDYAKKYASSHKDKKFVVEGVEIFGAYIDKIESLKDYAIYIKGTSLFNSYIRSAKRDSQDAETDFGKFKSFMKMIASSSRFKQYLTANTRLNKIKKQINEYVTESEDKSELTKGFKSKTSNIQYKTLSIDKPEIYDYLKNHFSKNDPMWEGVKDSKTYMDCFINGNNTRHVKRVGEVLINKANDEVIGFEVVEKPDNYLAIEIPDKKYRGYGFGSLLLEDAIKKHGCKKLYVAKDNKIAIKLYTNRGFEITGEFYDGEWWHMELKESDYTDRNSLPNSTFGIPSQRKFPLNDKAHVLAAIRMFNRVDREHEKELAHNIIKAMDKYGIKSDMVGKKNRLQTYLSDEDY